MSVVYRALDLRLDRPVAIKVMSPQYAADPTFLARFEREARAAARLDNPHVVGVFDQGRDGEHVFLVMELVDGGTLRDLLHQRGALSVPIALSVLESVLDALAAAHAAGLVHRDVKPENVLISARGEVKVADFGLVRAVTSTTMATGNVILGTVAYLSPEQVATGAADERSDVYSAGIVAYEMLTGHPPFAGDNALSVAYQHVHSDVPPVADDAPGVPVAIAAAVDAATSRDALARPVNAADFLHRLQDARADVGLALAPVPAPRPARRPAMHHTAQDERHAGQPTASSTGSRPQAGSGTRPTGGGGSGQYTEVAGRGTARAPRPDRLTTAHAKGAPTDRSRRRAARRNPDQVARARRRRRIRLIGLLVILVIGAAAAFGGWWLGGRWTSSPVVVGSAGDDAASAVREAGLVPVMSTAHSNSTPSGRVDSSKPTAGARELRGATVTLVVSAGRPVVPAIGPGTAVATARALVRAADLTPVTDADKDVYDNTVPEGTVVRTEPASGESAKIGAQVLLVRSRGPFPEQVPTVAGKLPEDARNKLLVAGFAIGDPVQRFDPDQPDGTVLGTEPPAGQTVPHGTAVSLVLAVSKTVPQVSGTVEEVSAELTDDGFDVTVGDAVFDPMVPGGSVSSIDPPAGTRIDPAHPAVTLIPSNAVTVPPLAGMTVAQSRQALADLGLQQQVSALFGGDNSYVTGQSPDRGQLVEPGSTVQVSAWP